jgi:hypothetical protein
MAAAVTSTAKSPNIWRTVTMNANFRPPGQADRVDGAETEPGAKRIPDGRAVPSISGLVAFEATARQLSFSHAACELTLTQGPASKRVRQPQGVLGITLTAPPEVTGYWLMPPLGPFHALHAEISVNLACRNRQKTPPSRSGWNARSVAPTAR